MLDIPYCQLNPKDALRVYADWLLEQRIDDPWPFFKCINQGAQSAEWYMIMYPLRTLMLASDILEDEKYRETAFEFLDLYCDEQLPNGGFTSNFRRQPTATLSKKEFHEILRTGKVNLADNGSNVVALIQAAMAKPGERAEKYLGAVRKWFDEWVPIWALPEGGYGNGIWVGHKINSPYTCAMGTVTAALSAFGLAMGEYEYIENAERCMKFQCDHWLDDGRPINFDCYPLPRKTALTDYGHSYYLLEGMCWTHFASQNEQVKALIEKRLTEWIFGDEGLLSQWSDSWLSFQLMAYPPEREGELAMSRLWIACGWEFAKSNGIPHSLLYYLRHIKDDVRLSEKMDRALCYLSHPLKARMSGVCSDLDESYGRYAVQATGFAGLTLAEAIQPDAVFESVR
jgi:hypothetical protein